LADFSVKCDDQKSKPTARRCAKTLLQ
jgi:hypothetical protein